MLRTWWDRFWMDCAHAVDNITVGICRATGGAKGEFYPCKPDIFEQTHEAVDD